MDRIRNDHSRARVCALVVAVIAVLGLSTGLRADDGVDAAARGSSSGVPGFRSCGRQVAVEEQRRQESQGR